MDNVYTKHLLVSQITHMTDVHVKVIGTIRLNNVDAVNRTAIKEALGRLKCSEEKSVIMPCSKSEQ